MVIWVIKAFLYSYSVCSCHLFLISFASVRSIPFLSFIVPILAWIVPFVSPIFLKRSLVFPFYCFPLLLFTAHLIMVSYFSLVFSGTLHSVWYLSLSPLPFASLLFSAFCKASSDNHFAFLHFFFLGMFLVTTSYTVLRTSIHSSLGTLSTRSKIYSDLRFRILD